MMLTVMLLLPPKRFLFSSWRKKAYKNICVCHGPAMQMERSRMQESCVAARLQSKGGWRENTIMC